MVGRFPDFITSVLVSWEFATSPLFSVKARRITVAVVGAEAKTLSLCLCLCVSVCVLFFGVAQG